MEQKINYSFQMEGQMIHFLMITHGTITKAIPMHSHSKNSYEAHYIFDGKGTLKVQGAVYDLFPGILFLTGPEIAHEQQPDPDDPMQEDCLYFYLENEFPNVGNTPVTDVFRSHPFWYGRDGQCIDATLQMLHKELEQNPRRLGHNAFMNACFQRYLVQLARNMVSFGQTEPKGISPVQLKIEDAFLYRYKDLTLNDICDITGMSRRQTQRLLTDYYGYGFQKKRTAARMAAASSFLLHSDHSAEQIAELTGYSSLSSFLQAFKAYYHMTLREYRELANLTSRKELPEP